MKNKKLNSIRPKLLISFATIYMINVNCEKSVTKLFLS